MRIVPQTILGLKWSLLPPSQGQKQILTISFANFRCKSWDFSWYLKVLHWVSLTCKLSVLNEHRKLEKIPANSNVVRSWLIKKFRAQTTMQFWTGAESCKIRVQCVFAWRVNFDRKQKTYGSFLPFLEIFSSNERSDWAKFHLKCLVVVWSCSNILTVPIFPNIFSSGFLCFSKNELDKSNLRVSATMRLTRRESRAAVGLLNSPNVWRTQIQVETVKSIWLLISNWQSYWKNGKKWKFSFCDWKSRSLSLICLRCSEPDFFSSYGHGKFQVSLVLLRGNPKVAKMFPFVYRAAVFISTNALFSGIFLPFFLVQLLIESSNFVLQFCWGIWAWKDFQNFFLGC